jgi:epoxide hydrolase-like predicted phosphatase
MTIRAVIWDMGGVLLRTEDPAPRQALAQRLGMDRFEMEERVFGRQAGHRAQRGEVSATQHWQDLCREFDWPVEEMRALQAQFFAGDRIDMDLLAYIEQLRPAYRVGLLSNAFDDLRMFLEKVLKIDHYFDDIVVSAEEGMMKPDPRIYQIAVERLGVAPEQAIFIDDFEHNILAAQAAGLHAVHFRNSAQACAQVQALLNGSGGKAAA